MAPTPVPMNTGQAGGIIRHPRLIVALLSRAVTPCEETQSLTHRERSTGELLTDHLELHVLELPKLQGALVEMDEPALAAWCRFLAAETDEELEALAMQHPILKDAKEALDKLSADPETREQAERREIELKLYEYGAAKLRAEGRAEGKQSALLELLTIKFGELPSVVQTRLEAATEVELDLWLKRLLSAGTLEAVFGDRERRGGVT
jgi:hypothetical protein